MILPNRHLTPHQSLIGVAARLLERLGHSQSVNQLWEASRSDRVVATFDRFVLALDLLFLVGAVELVGGELRVASAAGRGLAT
jgi:hypothetical protein